MSKQRIQLSDHFTYSRLLRFVLPCIGTMLFTSIYGIVDGLCVSNFVGKTAFAAVNLIMPLPMLLGTIGFMLGTGGSAIVGITLGEGDQKKADRYFTLFLLAALVSVSVLAVLGIVFLRPIAVLLGAKGELLDYAVRYGRILMVSLPTFALQNMFQSFFVTAEKPHLGFWFTVGAGCTNMVLDVLMVGIWGWGVEGAAIATVISRYVELAIVAGWTHSHKARNAFIVGAYRSMYIPGKLLRSITIKGMPLLVNEFLWSSGMAVLSQCYSTCGLDVVPAMNICSTLFNLGSVVYLSMGNSVGIIMGQMLGAGHSEEDVRDTNRKLIAVSIASGVMFGGLMAAVSEAFPGIYNTTDAVRHLAAQLIWISAVMMPFGSYLNATYFTLRSGGQTFVTFLFDSCFMWVFCVPLAFCLSRFTNLPILPLYAICQATDFIKCVIGTVMLKQGKWIQNLTV